MRGKGVEGINIRRFDTFPTPVIPRLPLGKTDKGGWS